MENFDMNFEFSTRFFGKSGLGTQRLLGQLWDERVPTQKGTTGIRAGFRYPALPPVATYNLHIPLPMHNIYISIWAAILVYFDGLTWSILQCAWTVSHLRIVYIYIYLRIEFDWQMILINTTATHMNSQLFKKQLTER